MTVKQILFLILYKFIFKQLPPSSYPVVGKMSKKLRYICCKNIFKECGKNVNIERKASFGNGLYIEIGDNSGIGKNCSLPNNTKIGHDVMMGPDVLILAANHKHNRTDIPMRIQGNDYALQTIIEDDVWIGTRVIMTPGRIVKKGSIIAAGTVLTKDFQEYSIIGGNPGRIIKNRI